MRQTRQACWASSRQAGAQQAQQTAVGQRRSMLAIWPHLNDLYRALCYVPLPALACFKAPVKPDARKVMTQAGIAPRYRKWVRRAFWLWSRRVGCAYRTDAFVGLRPLCQLVNLTWPDAYLCWRTSRRGLAWLRQSAQNLADILTEKLHSAQLYAAEEVPTVYQAGFQQANALCERWCGPCGAAGRDRCAFWKSALAMVRRPSHLADPTAGQTEYYFTDVSPFFLQRAQAEFAAYPFVQYGLLDLETPPEPQGYRFAFL